MLLEKNTDVTFLDVLLSVYGLFKIQKVCSFFLFLFLLPVVDEVGLNAALVSVSV